MDSRTKALRYVMPKDSNTTKVFACISKAQGNVVVQWFTPQAIMNMIDNGENTVDERGDGYRWNGRVFSKQTVKRDFMRAIIRGKCVNDFKVGRNGFMSDDQEQTVMSMLNDAANINWMTCNGENGKEKSDEERFLAGLLRLAKFEWTGHNHRRGVYDLRAEVNGVTIWVEVKGVHGRLFHS